LRVFILKPDAIGDFILASGTIALLARELGEKNLALAVRSDVAPLARSQFPAATTFPLTMREKRRILNVTAVNIIGSLPSWIRMLGISVDASVCLRSMRSYLHTVCFYTPRGKRRIACENQLLNSPRVRRPAVENFVRRAFKPTLLPYPGIGALPTDLEANRLVASELLGRNIASTEILPVLRTASGQSDRWLLCPFSSTRSKDYPAESWASVFKMLEPLRGSDPLHVAAGPSQAERLAEFAGTLRSCGVSNIMVDPPAGLAGFLDQLAASKVVFTVDTAAAHMACATRTPAIIASAGQHPGVYAPYSPDGRQVWVLPPPSMPQKQWRDAVSPALLAEKTRELWAQPSSP